MERKYGSPTSVSPCTEIKLIKLTNIPAPIPATWNVRSKPKKFRVLISTDYTQFLRRGWARARFETKNLEINSNSYLAGRDSGVNNYEAHDEVFNWRIWLASRPLPETESMLQTAPWKSRMRPANVSSDRLQCTAIVKTLKCFVLLLLTSAGLSYTRKW